jgi:16S rRNA (adenine1518-N6/adenine1519-N6)-dimethyltransferase
VTEENRSSRTLRPFAKRSLGQNFLVDPNTAAKIVRALDPHPGEPVLEIGPGRGALTRHIIEHGMKPVLLEMDSDLALELKSSYPQAEVVIGDAKRFAYERLERAGIAKVIGNLPYNVASVIIWELVRKINRFSRVVVMVQKEVAGRIVSAPGSKQYGILSVWVQSFVSPTLLFDVGPSVFKPQPKVRSSVLLFTPRPQGLLADLDPQALARTLHLCFQQRRKQLGTILKGQRTPEVDGWMASRGIEPSDRPETLSPVFFQELALILDSDAFGT